MTGFLGRIEKNRIKDRLFDIGLILCLLAFILNLTAWDGLDHSGQTEFVLKIMRVAALVFFVIVILINLAAGKYKLKWIIAYGFLIIVFGASYFQSKSSVLVYFLVVMAAAYRQDSRRLITISAILKAAILFVNLIGSYAGFSENFIFSEATRPRHGLGFSWATSGSILFFFFILEYIYLRKHKMRWWEFALLEGINVFYFIMTDARMAFVLSTAFIIFFFIESMLKNQWRVVEKIRWIFVFLPALFAVAAIAVSFLYTPATPGWSEIDDFISGRLYLGHYAIKDYGVSLFGQPINWVGYDINNLSGIGYNYVDCSYLQILLQFGVAAVCGCVAIYCLGIWRALRAKDGHLASIFVLIAIFSITEPRLMNLAFNVFPLLAFTRLNTKPVVFEKGWLKEIFTFEPEEEITQKHIPEYHVLSDEYEASSIKRNFIMNTILSVSSFVFPLITFPYVSRVLGPSGTGAVTFAFSIVGYFTIIAQLGIPTYGIRACAKVRDNKEELTRVAHELFMINIVMTIISYILLAVAIATIPQIREEKTLFIIVGLTLILSAIGMEWLYRALEQYTYITIRTIIFKIIAAIAMFMLIKSSDDYIIYGAIAVFSGSASFILNFIHARKFINFRWMGGYNFKRHIKPSVIFFALACATTIYTNLDAGMLGFMKGDRDVGYYNAAVRVKGIMLGIITSLGSVLLPRATYYMERGMEKEFEYLGRKSINFTFLLSIPIVVYFIIFAREGILTLSGAEYMGSIVPMQIIMPTIFLIGITNILGFQILTPMNREKTILWSVCAGAVADIILNIILIPLMGPSGAAIGTLVAEVVVLIYQLIALRTKDGILFGDIKFKKILVAIIVAVVVTLWVKILPFNSLVLIILSAVIFFGSYYLILMILKEPFVVDITHQITAKIKRTNNI